MNLDVRYSTSKGWPLTRLAQRQATFYGKWLPLDGHWRRTSSDPRAATLKIDYTAVVGRLTVRDYPKTTGPLFQSYWPENLMRPLAPDQLRWEWRENVKKRSVQRRWRTWRRDIKRFDRRLERLRAGACAPREASR